MIFRRLSIAKQIFTKEEVAELTKYEFVQLLEISKQYVEWFVYVLILLVWTGVFTLIVSLIKIEHQKDLQMVKEIKIEKEMKVEKELPAQKLAEEISKLPNYKSSLTPFDLTSKITLHALEWNIDPCFLLALIENETAGTFDEDIKASDYIKTNSVGWSQMTKQTLDWFNAQYVWLSYKEVWTEEDMKDPDNALTGICWYLNKLKDMESTDIKNNHDWYYYYNGGPNKPSPYSTKASKQALKNADKVMNLYNKYFVALK